MSGRLVAFNHVSLDGYFTGPGGDLGWTRHRDPDPDYDRFVEGNAAGGETLLLGRVTYQMMAGWWPTPAAAQAAPAVAERMNALTKVVFSRTLPAAEWANTRLVREGLAEEVGRLKTAGHGMAILGSGSLVAQLAETGLIDELHLVLNPVALGGGRTMFEGIRTPVRFRLEETRSFANGLIVASYRPAG